MKEHLFGVKQQCYNFVGTNNMSDVRIPLRNIGNSKGIIIPAAVLKQCRIDSEVELEIVESTIVITPIRTKRKDWFKGYDASKDDVDVIPDVFPDDLTDEWVW